MADSLLDRKKHPEWKGEPLQDGLCVPRQRNAVEQVRRRCTANRSPRGRNGEEATAFYLQHRLEMDDGARVYWPERFNPDEVSAIQHAMNRRIIDEFAFQAECQNEPLALEAAEEGAITAAEIAERLNRHKKGLVPPTVCRG